jgi:hypothetical protein
MSTKKKTPLQTYNPARLLRMGTCEVTRVEGAMEGTETLCIQLFPYSWKYPVTVDLGDTDLEPFAPGTPWKEILKSAVETEFSFLGKTFHVCLRCAKYPDFGSEGVELALHTTFTKNVKSGIGVATKPFAVWSIEAWNDPGKTEKAETKQHVYAVSVASFYENSGELTTHCAAFATPEKAADWFETDWNDQATYYGGRKLTKKARKAFLASLTDEKHGCIAEAESPATWGDCWFKWKGVRTEI